MGIMRNMTRPPDILSGHLPLACNIAVKWLMMDSATNPINVEFEDARNYHDRLRTTSILEHCETECRSAVDEESPTEALIVLNYPISTTVLSDLELEWTRARH
jgi:hypothetical protein